MVMLQRRPRYWPSVERSAQRAAPWRVSGWTRRRRERLGRVFVVLVVPVLLMLGSVYAHNVAVDYGREVARLAEENARAENEGERLEVRITELSEPGRIRVLARENLQMRDPGGKDLRTQGSDGEDVANGGGEKDKGTGG